MESKKLVRQAQKALAGYAGTAPRVHFVDVALKSMPIGGLCHPRIEPRQIWEHRVVRQSAVLWYVMRDMLRDIENAAVPMTESMLAAKALLDECGPLPALCKGDLAIAFPTLPHAARVQMEQQSGSGAFEDAPAG
jgi:hypothetical protein